MDAIPTEPLSPLIVWKLNRQINVPNLLPGLESVESGSELLLRLFVDGPWRSRRPIRWCACATYGASAEKLSLGIVDLVVDSMDKY